MMKKILALVLALAMCAGAGALAAEWAEGLGPNKPYAGSPEIDFNESFGYMMFLPVNADHVAPGASALSIYLPREDVEAGEGTIKLFSKEDGLVEEITVSAETLVRRELSEAELDGLLWGSGTVFEAKLSKPLAPNKHFYVQMDKGCIASTDFEVDSPAVTGKKVWTFETEVLSFVEDMAYYRMVEGEEEPQKVDAPVTGDMVKVSFVLGEDAAAAAVYCKSGTILPDETFLTESGEFTIRFPSSGEVEWGVVFVDAETEGIYSMDYVTTVADPMAIVEEATAE